MRVIASEKSFKNKVKKWLHSVGIYVAGTPSNQMSAEQCGWFFKVWGGGMQKSGIPDLLLCVNGLFVSVELKGEAGKSSDLQRMNTARVNQSNGIGIILYPAGFEEFQKIIKGVIDCENLMTSQVKFSANSKCCVITESY